MSEGYITEYPHGYMATGYSNMYFMFRSREAAEEYIRLSYLEEPMDWEESGKIAARLEEPLYHVGDLVDVTFNGVHVLTSRITRVSVRPEWHYLLLGNKMHGYAEHNLSLSSKKVPKTFDEAEEWFSYHDTEVILEQAGSDKNKIDECAAHNSHFIATKEIFNNETLWNLFLQRSINIYLRMKYAELMRKEFCI